MVNPIFDHHRVAMLREYWDRHPDAAREERPRWARITLDRAIYSKDEAEIPDPPELRYAIMVLGLPTISLYNVMDRIIKTGKRPDRDPVGYTHIDELFQLAPAKPVAVDSRQP